ncbi:hypothetical protein EVG20_g4108 [Dentipellis fragilis]|uniref:MYND-type domain-containing protein n=1 Tax=Dentipellis fragilis TaxID=205917 RepID=A0A4Y9YZG8_9AGAM|nr:hypothetical protein EVG20_g4108 [Dentipellis fragilis]
MPVVERPVVKQRSPAAASLNEDCDYAFTSLHVPSLLVLSLHGARVQLAKEKILLPHRKHPYGVRKLDFTCCDFDPAILARNVLLLSMISDGEEHAGHSWNIFFHLHLDSASHSYLVERCQRLIEYSENVQRWSQSPYGYFLRMSTVYTLSELRRHWTLYAGMHNLPADRLATLRLAFARQAKYSLDKTPHNLSPSRSAGPLIGYAQETSSDQFRRYWKSGTTFSNPKEIAAATFLNPTFAYSLSGEGCAVHYGSDPMMPFHFAAVFGNRKGSVSASDLVRAAKLQFSEWSTAFRRSVMLSSTFHPIVRFILADATIACQAFKAFALTRTLKLGIPIAQFRTQVMELSEDEYTVAGAPTSFSVIETSNLVDHIGLLNVLISAVPLLSGSTLSRVLYTESLLHLGEDATKEFTRQLYANITSIGVILDLCPVDYLSGFTTRSNTHELLYFQSKGNEQISQFHQVTTWKSPSSGDPYVCRSGEARRVVSFDARQLGAFLYDMYHLLFEQEDSHHFHRINKNNIIKAVSASSLAPYTRESFALFLKLVRDQLGVSDEDWTDVMDRFFDIHTADTSLPLDLNNFNDFCAHLHRHGVYTVEMYRTSARKIGRFAHWPVIPPVVRIILTVPREKLKVLEECPEEHGTPLMQCHVRGSMCLNIFSSIHVAYGRVTSMGTKSSPWATFEEDPLGLAGSSALAVTFTMSSRLLTDIQRPEDLFVSFALKSVSANMMFVPQLGFMLTIYEAKLMDESQVIVLPEQPLPFKRDLMGREPSASRARIGQPQPVSVELDEQCELVTVLNRRISVDTDEVKSLFQAGAVPEISQISPCAMKLSFGNHSQDILYPIPVIGSQNRVRLARKSLYIEVIVPVSGPFKAEGMNMNPFSVTSRGRVINPWSIHRVNLMRMPVLDIKAKYVDKWLNTHLSSMMSTREISLRKKQKEDVLTRVKYNLLALFVHATGIQRSPPHRLFCLRDHATNNCDTIFFISDIRYDLHSHTMVCDGYVLPLQPDLLQRIQRNFSELVEKGKMVDLTTRGDEMRAWKQLLPAFVERCRSSWQHGENCEYMAQGRIPLTEEMEHYPLCSCGKGKDTEGMNKVALWRKFAPYVTRVALSPLFAVSYLESIGRDPAAHKCSVCRGKGKPKLKACTGCKKVRYCSEACQKKDWKAHKPKCKP